MQAIEVIGSGREAVLSLGKAADPVPADEEVLIEVYASAVNRADLMQRRGHYPPPPGASPILGLECAGVVAACGRAVTGFAPGDRVMALLSGGGYAELACAHAGSVMRVPDSMDLALAAALPETFLTCYLNLFQIARAPAGGWALVHGGGSGIGTTAIQLLREAGVHVAVTCGSPEKCERCLALGADLAINYREQEFAPVLLERTGGEGVDVVLDSIGAPYLAAHLACLRTGGRLVWIGLMGGPRAELNIAAVMAKRLQLVGSTLRARSPAEKTEIVRGLLERFGAAIERGRVRPVVDRVLPLARAQEAHEVVERSEHFGKVVLAIR